MHSTEDGSNIRWSDYKCKQFQVVKFDLLTAKKSQADPWGGIFSSNAEILQKENKMERQILKEFERKDIAFQRDPLNSPLCVCVLGFPGVSLFFSFVSADGSRSWFWAPCSEVPSFYTLDRSTFPGNGHHMWTFWKIPPPTSMPHPSPYLHFPLFSFSKKRISFHFMDAKKKSYYWKIRISVEMVLSVSNC